MTPAQLLARVKKASLPPILLLLGPEAYQRRQVKDAITSTFAEGSLSQFDLAEVSLTEVLDDARSLSLFSNERLIWVLNAEAALPRTRAGSDEDGEQSGGAGDSGALAAY